MAPLNLNMAARASALAFGLALVGCVTPPAYGPIGHVENQYGYRDSQNTDGSYTILVIAASPPMAHEFWDRRAAEICGDAPFDKNIFRAQRPIVQVSGYATNAMNPAYGASYTQDAYGDFIMEGYLRCEGPADMTAQLTESAPVEAPAATTP